MLHAVHFLNPGTLLQTPVFMGYSKKKKFDHLIKTRDQKKSIIHLLMYIHLLKARF